MATVNKTFNVALTQQHKFVTQIKKSGPKNVEVNSILIQSNNVYKGDFEKVEDLRQISAVVGDYADVFETNTRWANVNGQWVNTGKTILINPLVATTQALSLTNTRVAELEDAIEHPILVITKI